MKSTFRPEIVMLCGMYPLPAGVCHAASFDCAKARTVLEQTICADELLDRVDTRLGEVYWKLHKFLDERDASALKKDQINWLKHRIDRCKEDDAACLLPLYQARIKLLQQAYAKYSGAHTATGVVAALAEEGPAYTVEFTGIETGVMEFNVTDPADFAPGTHLRIHYKRPKVRLALALGPAQDEPLAASSVPNELQHIRGRCVHVDGGYFVLQSTTGERMEFVMHDDLNIVDIVKYTGQSIEVAYIEEERVLLLGHRRLEPAEVQ